MKNKKTIPHKFLKYTSAYLGTPKPLPNNKDAYIRPIYYVFWRIKSHKVKIWSDFCPVIVTPSRGRAEDLEITVVIDELEDKSEYGINKATIEAAWDYLMGGDFGDSFKIGNFEAVAPTYKVPKKFASNLTRFELK